MGVLVACCFLIGLAPLLVVPVLGKASRRGLPHRADPALAWLELAPLGWITIMGLLLIVARCCWAPWCSGCACAAPSSAQDATWGCGYCAPTSPMQYTSSSFAEMLVGLFGWVLRPRIARAQESAAVPADRPIFTARCPTRCSTRPCCRRSVSGLAVLLVPGVPAGEHPDLLALYLHRPDCAVALALGET